MGSTDRRKLALAVIELVRLLAAAAAGWIGGLQ